MVNQDNEKEYWNYLYQSNNVTKTPKNIQFIQRWKKMEEVLQTSDILVIAKYLGEKKTKIAKISKNTKSIQRGKENEYKIYKLEDVKVSPHCDDQNTNLERIRCFMFMLGGDFIFNINGKSIRLSETCDNILFDCTTEHYGCSTSSNPTYAIIIDLMRKDISPVEELGYMIKPLYYYMEKQCST